MGLDAESMARRFALRPGYRFVAYKGVALAVFAMDLRVLSLESRDVLPIQEFLIKFMAEGISSLSVLSDLLGLEEGLVESCLVDLRRQEIIDVLSRDGNTTAVDCVLTSRGKQVATSLKQVTMQEITIPNVIFHGLLRNPVDMGGFARRQYLKPKEAQDIGLDLVRAIPNRYPYPEEINIEKLTRVMKQVYHSKSDKHDVIAVRSVLKNVRTIYEPAVMIEYETDDDQRQRVVSFIVDGQLRNDYEDAFLRSRGPELLANMLASHKKTLVDRLREEARPDIVKKLGRIDDVEILAAKVVAAQQEVQDKREQISQLERSDTKEKQRQEIIELNKALEESLRKLSEAECERNQRKVKYLWTPEIKDKLWEAINTVEKKLLILSGWISSEVLNEKMAGALRNALSRGVKIWIGYGFDKDSRRGKEQREQPRWKEAEATLLGMKKDFPDQMVFLDIGYIHDKRLICDDRFTFGGSFNLLSFTGESWGNKRLRHESVDLIEDSGYCKELWLRILKDLFPAQNA